MERHPSLPRMAVELLARRLGPRTGDRLASGARRAVELGLAGIYQAGLEESGLSQDQRRREWIQRLTRARRREVAHALASRRQALEVLDALARAGVTPVVLKGQPLAERLWPQPWMRPSGDLDLLVEEDALGDTLSVLLRNQYRPLEGAPPGRWRPAFAEVHMRPPGPSSDVDVHTRPFRTFGEGLSARKVLSRAIQDTLGGVPIRRLDPADEILFLLIHAAKHGRVHPKWLLDVYAAALACGRGLWAQVTERALAAGATRACWATLRLLRSRLPGPVEMQAHLNPGALTRLLISGTIRLTGSGGHIPRGQWHNYSINWLLEDRLAARLRRLLGVLERLRNTALARIAPRHRSRRMGELRNRRWLEHALRQGSAPLWITLDGGSMVPTFKPGDQLLVAPLRRQEAPTEGEVVIARQAGRLVAHRLLRVTELGVVTRGDGARSEDLPVAAHEVLARVIASRRVSPEPKVNQLINGR